jgi:hypothetical protein
MAFEALVTGAVFIYPYLWHRQAEAGETEGRKERPVAVTFRIGTIDGLEHIIVIPITSKAPLADQLAVELPQIEKRRAGLDQNMRLWLVLDEANIDVVGKSYYLRDQQPIGHLSKSFFIPVARQFVDYFKSANKVDRTR